MLNKFKQVGVTAHLVTSKAVTVGSSPAGLFLGTYIKFCHLDGPKSQ